jgi:hypothetical protein
MNGKDDNRRAEHFLTEVRNEFRRASELHNPIRTAHEAAAVIREEFEEFWELVKQKHHNKRRMCEELVQVAAMCTRAVVNLDL